MNDGPPGLNSAGTLITDLHLTAAGAWVVLDTNTPPLNKLTVIGVLEVDDPVSGSRQARSTHGTVVIDAVYISIQASRTQGLFVLCDDDDDTRSPPDGRLSMSLHSEMMRFREDG